MKTKINLRTLSDNAKCVTIAKKKMVHLRNAKKFYPKTAGCGDLFSTKYRICACQNYLSKKCFTYVTYVCTYFVLKSNTASFYTCREGGAKRSQDDYS
ncbi:hypothetical protein PR048_020930 [Dryococelus australis]|uniref:Uncharacterized protein n=1 Tax=Dryococelus australis TaxID=614101 RepID=A0ABQ9GWT0_9NEOP|nr:hypothetical protein PR048_020930 [Dryococelus australis]